MVSPLVVEQVPDAFEKLQVPVVIQPLPLGGANGSDLGEFAFPVAQHGRIEPQKLGGLSYAIRPAHTATLSPTHVISHPRPQRDS